MIRAKLDIQFLKLWDAGMGIISGSGKTTFTKLQHSQLQNMDFSSANKLEDEQHCRQTI